MPRPLIIAAIALVVVAAGCIAERHDAWPSGKPKAHGHLASGKQTGQWTYWYESGTKQAAGGWAKDRQDGDWSWWYEDGKDKQRGRYAASLRVGTWTYWYPNGRLYCRGDYEDDHQVGPWTYFHQDGKPAAVGVFDHGAKALGWRWWREDGTPQEQGAYWAGRKIGPWTTWGVDGVAKTTDQGVPPGMDCWREPASGEPVRRWIARTSDRAAADAVELTLTYDERGLLTGASAARVAGADPLGVAERYVAYAPAGGIVASYVGASTLAARRDLATTVIDANAGAWALWTPAGENDADPAHAAAAKRALIDLHAPPAQPAHVAKAPEAKLDLALPETGHVALTPMAVLPISYWTKREEANAGLLIEKYLTGRWPQSGAAGYGSDEMSASGNQRRDLHGKPLAFTRLLSATGDVIDLDDYKGSKNVVLVVLRGFAGQVCVYCATQTAALAKSLERFRAADTEVVLVYPGAPESVPVFIDAVRSLGVDQPKIAVALDVDLQLVRALKISHQLAKPTSLIIDKQGIVRYAYVGENRADRPSADDLLRQIQKLEVQKLEPPR